MTRWTVKDLAKSPCFHQLTELVSRRLAQLAEQDDTRRPALESEKRQLEERMRGWVLSLGDPQLNPLTRRAIEAQYGEAEERVAVVRRQLESLAAERGQVAELVTSEKVAASLNRLADVLVTDNPARANLELSLHIDRIVVREDGRVVIRTCKLGAISGAAEMLAVQHPEPLTPLESPTGASRARIRRRSRLRVGSHDENGMNLDDAAHYAAEVNRFAGLGPEYFWDDEFVIPEKTFWAKENAAAVAAKRAEGLTHEKLAEHFQVSTPTIRHALKLAAQADTSMAKLPRKMPRTRWPDQHYAEVAGLRREGKSTKHIAEMFKLSERWIAEALKLAESKGLIASGTSPTC